VQLSEPHTRASAVLLYEVDTSALECVSHGFNGIVRHLTPPLFEIDNSRQSEARLVREFGLRHFQEGSCASALGGGHFDINILC